MNASISFGTPTKQSSLALKYYEIKDYIFIFPSSFRYTFNEEDIVPSVPVSAGCENWRFLVDFKRRFEFFTFNTWLFYVNKAIFNI